MSEPGADEVSRLLSLLWRHELPPRPGGRGPKQTVSVDEVVAAAVALADRDGYDKVSVRAVAAELGLRPMSLYTYVPSKDALTILMADAVAFEDEEIPRDRPARERLATIARQARAELLAHPWLLEVSPWRLELGPGRMRRYERRLAAVDGIGFTDVEMDRVIAVLSEFAIGNARMTLAARRSAEQLSDARWWEVHGPLLTQVMPAAEFPLSSRVGTVVGELYQAPGDPEGDFEYGLARLLDGILSRQRPQRAPDGSPAAD
ncbi:TetR/AcrR family transcriptional regulator [Nocardia donostiensis]|uniref:TetR family transcriptional regulator n=1 Tax=Nocardia donostiensis TaxID=1538463 RepID=A0A1V2TE15_9NOCA|nr:TetR/AcrR family transcriptional regulator C-terminal domain-containing protein [Nocardia donostiensis]ONM47746.1 TetR family transcriptional regulator [Nocardia donostiensis]OQS13677.1 TetR family transcriptional regulator [Nocardia donostiensis]OQS22498.1 TetR family transcriptional regulator [Nocardia donostiensis]